MREPYKRNTVFNATNIDVNGHEVLDDSRIEGGLSILSVEVSEEVPRAVDEGVHRVRLPASLATTPRTPRTQPGRRRLAERRDVSKLGVVWGGDWEWEWRVHNAWSGGMVCSCSFGCGRGRGWHSFGCRWLRFFGGLRLSEGGCVHFGWQLG